MKRLIVGMLVALAFMLVPASYAQAAHSTVFTFVASTSTGATYNAYKQAGCAGAFVKLNTAPILTASFTDTGMADGEINCYLFTAVITVAGVASESAQAQSEIARVVTPVTPTITPGQAFVGPPGHVTPKSA